MVFVQRDVDTEAPRITSRISVIRFGDYSSKLIKLFTHFNFSTTIIHVAIASMQTPATLHPSSAFYCSFGFSSHAEG